MTTKPAPRPMATAPDTDKAAGRAERRSGVDRRRVDKGPPGGRERRRHVEARLPDVAEIEMSPSEWDALARSLPPPEGPGGKKS
jgi:hypothetical protein